MDLKSKNNFKHYFLASEHNSSDYFHFYFELYNQRFDFTSCDDVFSKEKIDDGSLILIKTLLKLDNLNGKILDIACGYGAIGVILSRFLDLPIDMCDINSTALDLCRINAKNNLKNIGEIFESDMWQNVQGKYNHIVSNPPIKVGKSVLIDFINGLSEHLEIGGDVTIVIKKNLGADSTKKYLKDVFGNCEVLERDKGYYILQSVKNA